MFKTKVMYLGKDKVACQVELECDLERCFAYMAETAFRNVSKRTKFGPVRVKVKPMAKAKPLPLTDEQKRELSETNRALNAALFGR